MYTVRRAACHLYPALWELGTFRQHLLDAPEFLWAGRHMAVLNPGVPCALQTGAPCELNRR